jgi:hypothetical protein
MRWWRRLRIRIQRALYLPAAANREMDDEIRFHLAEETRLQAERGLPPAEAAAVARRAFGSVALAKENTRAVWVSTRLEQVAQDLRIGCRILTKAPAVSATAVILIALVIGGNTTVFSIAHGIISKPAPGVHATGLTTLSWVAENGDIETHAEHRVFAHFQEQSAALQIAAVDFQRVTLTHDNGSYAARLAIVSPNYFDTLGIRLVHGRSFTQDEAERGTSGLVVVIGHHVWQNSFGGIHNIVGQKMASPRRSSAWSIRSSAAHGWRRWATSGCRWPASFGSGCSRIDRVSPWRCSDAGRRGFRLPARNPSSRRSGRSCNAPTPSSIRRSG